MPAWPWSRGVRRRQPTAVAGHAIRRGRRAAGLRLLREPGEWADRPRVPGQKRDHRRSVSPGGGGRPPRTRGRCLLDGRTRYRQSRSPDWSCSRCWPSSRPGWSARTGGCGPSGTQPSGGWPARRPARAEPERSGSGRSAAVPIQRAVLPVDGGVLRAGEGREVPLRESLGPGSLAVFVRPECGFSRRLLPELAGARLPTRPRWSSSAMGIRVIWRWAASSCRGPIRPGRRAGPGRARDSGGGADPGGAAGRSRGRRG